MERIQVTLFSATGKYKPIATTIKVDSIAWATEHKEELKRRAVAKICAERKTDTWALQRDGYTRVKMRVYHSERV